MKKGELVIIGIRGLLFFLLCFFVLSSAFAGAPLRNDKNVILQKDQLSTPRDSAIDTHEVFIELTSPMGEKHFCKLKFHPKENLLRATDCGHGLGKGIYLVSASSDKRCFQKKLVIN